MASPPRPVSLDSILVVGLGRFGRAAARSLTDLGHEVLVVDIDPDAVSQIAPMVDVAVEADATDDVALRQIGAQDFNVAIVAVGDVKESVLTVAALTDVGVEEIWAKANDRRHGAILERIGAAHVVYPEQQMGDRVAKTVSATVEDYVEVEGAFALAKVHPPREIQDLTLAQCQLRTRHGVVAVGVKRDAEGFVFATPDMRVAATDILVVGGEIDDVKAFAQIAHTDAGAPASGAL